VGTAQSPDPAPVAVVGRVVPRRGTPIGEPAGIGIAQVYAKAAALAGVPGKAARAATAGTPARPPAALTWIVSWPSSTATEPSRSVR
jgi:hypothetical protein